MNQLTICMIIFVLIIIGYMAGKFTMATTALLGMLLMVVTGCLSGETALSGFANSSTIIMACMFIVGAGLTRTQAVHKLSNLVYKISGGSFTKGLAGYVLVTFAIAQLLGSSVLVFSICYPLVLDYCRKMEVNSSKAMMSVGLVAIGSVETLPIGFEASQYLANNTLLQTYGDTEHTFGMFSYALGRIPITIAVILCAIFIIPKRVPDVAFSKDSEFQENKRKEKTPLDPVREALEYLIFIGTVIGLLVQPYIPGLESWVVCMAGALLVVMTGVLGAREAVSSVNWGVVFLYVGSLGIGNALAETGAGEMIGNTISSMLGGQPNGYLVGLVFFAIPYILTQFMNNWGVVNIFNPIAILSCLSMGYDPRGPMILVLAGSLTAFMTPMATPAVPLMMGAGNYSQKDLLKAGWLPSLIICAVAVLWVMTVYPVTG